MIFLTPTFFRCSNFLFHRVSNATQFKSQKIPLFFFVRDKKLNVLYSISRKLCFSPLNVFIGDYYLNYLDAGGDVIMTEYSSDVPFRLKLIGQYMFNKKVRKVYMANGISCYNPINGLIYGIFEASIYSIDLSKRTLTPKFVASCSVTGDTIANIKASPSGIIYGTVHLHPILGSKASLSYGAPFICNIKDSRPTINIARKFIIDDTDELICLGKQLVFYSRTSSDSLTFNLLNSSWKKNKEFDENASSIYDAFTYFYRVNRLTILSFYKGSIRKPNYSISLGREIDKPFNNSFLNFKLLSNLTSCLQRNYLNQWAPQCFNASQKTLLFSVKRNGHLCHYLVQERNGTWKILNTLIPDAFYISAISADFHFISSSP